MEPNDTDRERVVDQWLEEELRRYGKAEPRSGLEMRVLASLHAEKDRIAARRRWWWAAGMMGATAAVIAVVWFGHADRAHRPAGASIAAHHENAGAPPQSISKPPVVKQTARAAQRRGMRQTAREAQVAPPKLDQFPAPAPLNEQEQLLARYVREFPQKAALVARAQTELQKQDEREMAAPWPETTNSTGLEQPE